MAPGDVPNLPTALKRARKAAKFSNAKDFLVAVKASGRKAPSYSTYAQWESGEVTPRDETLGPIVEYHREKDTWPEEATDADLASAIRELATELRLAREARELTEARLRAVEAELESLRAAPAAEESPAPPARPHSAGSGR